MVNIAVVSIITKIIKMTPIINLPRYISPNPGIMNDSTAANIGFFAINFLPPPNIALIENCYHMFKYFYITLIQSENNTKI